LQDNVVLAPARDKPVKANNVGMSGARPDGPPLPKGVAIPPVALDQVAFAAPAGTHRVNPHQLPLTQQFPARACPLFSLDASRLRASRRSSHRGVPTPFLPDLTAAFAPQAPQAPPHAGAPPGSSFAAVVRVEDAGLFHLRGVRRNPHREAAGKDEFDPVFASHGEEVADRGPLPPVLAAVQ